LTTYIYLKRKKGQNAVSGVRLGEAASLLLARRKEMFEA